MIISTSLAAEDYYYIFMKYIFPNHFFTNLSFFSLVYIYVFSNLIFGLHFNSGHPDPYRQVKLSTYQSNTETIKVKPSEVTIIQR